MKDPYRIKRILTKLETLWQKNPDATLGQLIEMVENTAWAPAQATRDFSPRLMFLPDEWFEGALNHHLK